MKKVAAQRSNRRRFLAAAAMTGLGWAGANACAKAPSTSELTDAVSSYLLARRTSDGRFGWHDLPRPHLTPTFAAIGCFQILGRPLPEPAKTAEFVREHHPFRIKRLERDLRVFDYQQIQSLLWLGEDVAPFREAVQTWTKPAVYPRQYEQHGYPVFQNELKAFVCRKLLGLPLTDLAGNYDKYLDDRRRASGSFNGTPAADGSDGHVMNTWWGLEALAALDASRLAEKRTETIRWLRACQREGGGFTYQPKTEIGALDDVAYTWAAVLALKLLGSAPANRDGCVAYLWSLRNGDGGFGDRPGWDSNPMATWRALAALEALDALHAPAPASRRGIARTVPLPKQAFTIQLEAHGQGSPAEAVDLAGALRIHLWGAKNARPGWIARAQEIAAQRHVPVTFFVADEEYGTWVDVPGLGTYSHTSDIFAPSGSNIGPSLANRGVLAWREYQERRLRPLEAGGGRLLWQFGENEELTRILLDDSLSRGGFSAISTFHFGNPDFTNSSPFLQRYHGQLPFVALQDAHGSEPWWFADTTTGFRTVFLANEPTWDAWLEALRQKWTVAIRHDAVSQGETWMHGLPDVIARVNERRSDWQWWDNEAIQRPLVSIVALTPRDEFETARPEQGIAIRVRCAWENTTQGLPKKPLTELIDLTINGSQAATELIKVPGPRGGLKDHYHIARLPSAVPGKYRVIAGVRVLATGKTVQRSIEFQV
jgi:hypothetical protein